MSGPTVRVKGFVKVPLPSYDPRAYLPAAPTPGSSVYDFPYAATLTDAVAREGVETKATAFG